MYAYVSCWRGCDCCPHTDVHCLLSFSPLYTLMYVRTHFVVRQYLKHPSLYRKCKSSFLRRLNSILNDMGNGSLCVAQNTHTKTTVGKGRALSSEERGQIYTLALLPMGLKRLPFKSRRRTQPIETTSCEKSEYNAEQGSSQWKTITSCCSCSR